MATGQIPSLPQEIMVEILSRLPAKSVAQFRCVSKPWRVLLSDPQFINTHLSNRRTEENLILIFRDHSMHTIADVGDDNISRTISFQPELPETWTKVVGSCNGLVLLLNGGNGMFLVNPTTLNQVKIPDLPALVKSRSFLVCGLWHDAASDDYKIAIISDYSTDEVDIVGPFANMCAFVYVYSMKRGIWRTLEPFSNYYHVVFTAFDSYASSRGAFVNDAIHWLAYAKETGGSFVIVAFDLIDERFKEIPTPGCLDVKNFAYKQLVVLKGCLCMFDKLNIDDGVDIWMMEEYGIEKSWVKLGITSDNDWLTVKPLCFIGDDKIVLEIDGNRLIVYKFKAGTLRDFMVDGVPAMIINGGTFLESLVSPSYRDEQ